MYHPTSRVLTVLELLQSHPSITGPELAARLEMDVRTVRRYIMHLQDVGIPIESSIGRLGGYRIRPGFKLPPLMLNEEEATAVVLGLLASSWLALDQSSLAIEGALAKVSRVLPLQSRELLQALTEHLVLYSHNQQERPAASLMIDLSQAIHATQRIRIKYQSSRLESTERKVEPYGMTGWKGRWYLGGFCCLRQEYRVFRLDRIREVQILSETFEPSLDFDYKSFIRKRSDAQEPLIEVEFQADLPTVRQKLPAIYGTLTPTVNGVLLQEHYSDMEGIALRLMALNLPFVVHQPPALREALQRLGERMLQYASQVPSTAH